MPPMSLAPPTRRWLVAALATMTALGGTACSSTRSGDGTTPTAVSTGSMPKGTPLTITPQEDGMRIQITIGDERFHATLSDSAATRDLVAQLPVTIDMVDHGQVEKTGPLPSPLSLAGQPDGADPDVGDIGYYAPGDDLVLYYGDQFFFPGIVILGRLDGDAAQRLSALEGAVSARVEALDD